MSRARHECPVCKQPLLENQDIVTCPECGAQYHRACYQQQGRCVYEAKHGTGFVAEAAADRQRETAPAAGTHQYAADTISCRACGTQNAARNIFCENCGTPLHGQPAAQAAGGAQGGAGGYAAGFGPQPIDPAAKIDDIPVADWTEYVGRSAQVYIPRFMQQQTRGGWFGVIPSAFLLGPFYYAYRKMWGWAVLTGLLWLLFSVPSFMLVLQFAGNPLVASFSLETLDTLARVAYFANIITRLLCALSALYFYRRKCARDIGKLRQQHPDDAVYHEALRQKGDVSIAGVCLVAALMFVVLMLVSNYMGDDVMSFYNSLMDYMA